MEKKQIKIKIRDEDLKGVYSNLMQIYHTKEEFCFDFFNVFPPQGILVTRVLMNPAHLKRMIRALQESQDALWKRVTLGVRGGWLRVDRAQTMVGLEPDPSQAVYLRGMNIMETPAKAAPEAWARGPLSLEMHTRLSRRSMRPPPPRRRRALLSWGPDARSSTVSRSSTVTVPNWTSARSRQSRRWSRLNLGS